MCEIEPNLIPEYFNESQQKSNAPQDSVCAKERAYAQRQLSFAVYRLSPVNFFFCFFAFGKSFDD